MMSPASNPSARPTASRRRSGYSPGLVDQPPMEPVFFATPAEFRAWLEANHSTETELYVGFYKKASGRPTLTWPEAVEQALCFGWIDGIRRTIDDISYTNRFTPRRPRSTWSAINIRTVERLIAEGQM